MLAAPWALLAMPRSGRDRPRRRTGEVEISVSAVEDDDAEVDVPLDQVDQLGDLGDGRCADRVDGRMVERHPAVSQSCGGPS